MACDHRELGDDTIGMVLKMKEEIENLKKNIKRE